MLVCHTHKMDTCLKLAGENWEAFFLCVYCCVQIICQRIQNLHISKETESLKMTFFFFWWGLGYVYVDSCTVAGASHYSHLGPYVLARLWVLHIYWSAITVILAICCSTDGGWGKLVIQMLKFHCCVLCKRIWVMCLLVWLQMLYWSFSLSSIAKCTVPSPLFYTQVMLLKEWA
jgi:hypothetical protein